MAHRRSSPVRSRRRYRPRVSVVPEQTFRVAGPALPVDVVHKSGHVSVGWRVLDEFRIAFQDGFELEHARETACFPDLFDFLLRVQGAIPDPVSFFAIVVGLFCELSHGQVR